MKALTAIVFFVFGVLLHVQATAVWGFLSPYGKQLLDFAMEKMR